MYRNAIVALSFTSLSLSLVTRHSPDVTWITPSEGDTFAAGDTLVAQWKAEKAVVSPSFRLCTALDDSDGRSRSIRREVEDDDDEDESVDGSCGQAVWPTIQHTDDGTYTIHMTLPASAATSKCYVEMVDDFGDKMASPTFSFGSKGVGTSSSKATDKSASEESTSSTVAGSADGAANDTQVSDSPEDSQTADSDSEDTGASNPQTQDTDASGDPTAQTPLSVPSSPPAASDPNSEASPTLANLPSPSVDPSQIITSPTPLPTPPSLDESHAPTPTAAYAVPLSLVGSVILAAGGASLHQRRKLRAERAKEQQSLQGQTQPPPGAGNSMSRRSTLSWAGFVTLGQGPAPSTRSGSDRAYRETREHEEYPRIASRSTSVSTLRAWRRDVSRYHVKYPYDHPPPSSRHQHHPRGSALDDEETYVDSSRASVRTGNYRSPERQPRRATREPYYTASSRPRGCGSQDGWAPASAFRDTGDWERHRGDGDRERSWRRAPPRERARMREYSLDDAYYDDLGKAPRTPASPPLSSTASSLKRSRRRYADGRGYRNASVNEAVLARYLDSDPELHHALSPVPLSPSPAPPREERHDPPYWDMLARPERLHVRRTADNAGNETLPVFPPKDYDRDLYDVVARKLDKRSR